MLGRRAIVLGASMAGLLAARILAERYDEVWLLERDTLPDGAQPRKGTPQAQHAHGLLARGRDVLEQLFPGFTAALAARGAMVGDALAQAPFVAGGRRFAVGAPCRHAGLACSRLAIEDEVRRRVLALPRVTAMTDVDVVRPVLDDARQRVTGVAVVHRAGGAGEMLAADLVVDCTGRGSRMPAWLREWGYDAPQEERVTVGIGYATAYFERQPQHESGLAALIFAATPGLPLPGVLIGQEPADDGVPRWVVTLGGYAGDHPPATLEGMRERAGRMGDPMLLEILRSARPLGPVTRYAFPHSQRRRYERLARLPQGLLALGDAIASFNPVYGQGMTVAACEALALRRALDGGLPGLQRRYFGAAAKGVDVAWQLAVGADLALPGVPGDRPAPVRLVNAWLARVLAAAPHDHQVAAAFMKVAHLVAPPPTIFAPNIVWRVLRGGRPGPGVLARAPGSVESSA
jgi:2-polyprenyl-6-methoxyphenol hydroxylase-like FAD-dependent oxidoreductase